MKRSVWKVLAVLMALAVFMTTMASAAGSDKFTDVPSDSWYKQYVDFVVDNGYMNGVSSTKFAPNDNLTRAMFATILARYDGATVDNSKATAFSDVAVNQWYTGSIAWANEKGIVNGTGSGKFSPEANITRQDLCVMVERYITYVESTTDKVHVTPGVAKTFTDEGQIASYAKSAMDKAVIHGLIFGYPDGSVRPTQNITRAECAAIISRIAWKSGDGKDSHEMTFYDAKGNVQETVTVKTGDTFTVPQGPAKDNATFKGWNTSKDGSGTAYQPGDKILLTSDMSLYPQYEEAAPPVIPGGGGGGGGGGSGPTGDKTEYNVTVSISAGTFHLGGKSSQTLQLAKHYKGDQTLSTVAKDLIAGENEKAIKNAIKAVLAKMPGNYSLGGWNVEIKNKNNGKEDNPQCVMTVTKNGKSQVADFYNNEIAVFNGRVNTIKNNLPSNAKDLFVTFANTMSPKELFTLDDGSNQLKFKTADEYYQLLSKSVEAGLALQGKLNADQWNIVFGEDGFVNLNTKGGLDTDTLAKSSSEKVLSDLVGEKTLIKETDVTDIDKVKASIKKITNRDYAGNEAAEAILKAALEKGSIKGNYTLTFKVTKN